MTARQTGQRFRQRKLSVKQNLTIVKEHEIETTILDDEAQRNIPKVETGVEKGEEIEHHLQAVISAAQAGAKTQTLYIPTPETNRSALQYERLYPRQFQQPQTYIRFSSTVEDCVGCPYCMTAEDEIFLKQLNARQKKAAHCSEDQFEEVMNFFEQTSSAKQPFAAVDNAPVLTYEEMEAAFDEDLDVSAQRFARDIYQHWKSRRLESLNHALMPTLKFERNVETDDSDPYVCFRRREVRQVRKTRGRDAQVVEKLKKLRSELEQARHLMHFVKQREVARREQLSLERQIFDQRTLVKESKRNLGLKTDDEDLINQRPIPKPRPKLDPAIIQRGAMGAGMIPKAPLTVRADGRPPDSDLLQLADEKARKENEINSIIQDSMQKHKTWNTDWVDQTWRPITPPLENAHGGRNPFRAAHTQPLPTPPSSVSEGEDVNMMDGGRTPVTQEEKTVTKLPIRYVSPPAEPQGHGMTLRPSYRRRQGRGGRLFIDRRGLKRQRLDEDEDDEDDESRTDSPFSLSLIRKDREQDRAAYDLDSDEDTQVYFTDPYDDWNIKYRIAFGYSPSRSNQEQVEMQRKLLEEQQRRHQHAAAQAGANGARAALPAAQNAAG